MKNLSSTKGRSLFFVKFDLKMKLTVLFTFATFFSVLANTGYSQPITLDVEDLAIEKIIDRIEVTSDYTFVYNTKFVDLKRKVSIKVREASIESILTKLFNDTRTSFKVVDTEIFLRKKKNRKIGLIEQPTLKIIQEHNVKGIVQDTNGQPLPGANIIEKGTTNGTQTDFDGNFSIDVTDENAILVVSYLGFLTKEVTVGGESNITITMQEDSAKLDEVVIVGYGSQKKSDLTGSIASVKADEVVQLPIARVDQAIQGRISGVAISNDKSQPGSRPVIRIRGDNSILGNNEPLVVVDGILGADMSILNPSEIESVEILKDASAKAIYGSRGANGVIIISTKKGKSGKTRFDFSSFASISEVANTIDLLSAEEHYDFLSALPTSAPNYINAQELLNQYDRNSLAGNDWQDVIFNSGLTQNYQLNVSGGSDKTTFIISAGYFDQEGIVPNSGYNRETLRARIESKATDKLDIGANLYLAYSEQSNSRVDSQGGSGGGSITQAANRFSPIIPVFDSEGNYSLPVPSNAQLNNPMALLNERRDELNEFSLTANVFAKYKILDELTFRSSYTKWYGNSKRNFWAGKVLLEAFGTGRASITNTNTNRWLYENTLTFDKVLGKHHITVLGGIEASKNTFPSVEANSQGFPTESLQFNALELGMPEGQSVQSGIIENSTLSYLGRVNYVLDGKYLLTANFRADGSSKFAKNNKWGFFPSIALGWRISDEPFMDNISKISNLKLRGSYGSIGSQAIEPYQSLASFSNTIIPLGQSFFTAVRPERTPNPDLKWETTTETNIGIDLGLFNNRVNIVADYYTKDTKDLLYSKNLPTYTGFSSQIQNIGSINNKGFEFNLSTVNIDTEDFKWNTGFNISFNKNKVIDLGGDQFQVLDFSGGALGEAWRSVGILQVGEALGNFYGFIYDGLYQNEAECAALEYPIGACEPGGIKLRDISGPDGVPDGQITADDRTIIGNGLPDYTFGFSNDFTYKNFDLNIFFQGSHGNDIMNLNRVKLENVSNTFNENLLSTVLTETWTGEGTSNTIQKVGSPLGPPSSRFVEDGSFIRLKNIALGYSIPSAVLDKWNLSRFRIYISGQNLLTITDYSGYDPEINSRTGNLGRGYDYGGYPTAKTYTIGLNVAF